MIIQTPEAVMFWILAPIAVLSALGMLLVKKAVHSALLLAWVMITLAIFYIAQDALFLGIVQIVVYTGAVMMLFLFIPAATTKLSTLCPSCLARSAVPKVLVW